jgi:hypothetical protein
MNKRFNKKIRKKKGEKKNIYLRHTKIDYNTATIIEKKLT